MFLTLLIIAGIAILFRPNLAIPIIIFTGIVLTHPLLALAILMSVITITAVIYYNQNRPHNRSINNDKH